MAINAEKQDGLYFLSQLLINENYCINSNEEQHTIHGLMLNIWLRQLYLLLLKPYEVEPSDIMNYDYKCTPNEIQSFLDRTTLDRYSVLSKKWFDLVPKLLLEEYDQLSTNKMERLETFYKDEKGFNDLQWNSMHDSILKSEEEIRNRLRDLPLLFLEALQLQYIFGIMTLPGDFSRRVELLTDNLMLFANVTEGGSHNYVLFRGFTKYPLQIVPRVTLREFCNFLEYMFDGENENQKMRAICRNLIQQTINSIAYSKAIVRNTENQHLRRSINGIMELIIDNQDFFPKVMEEYEPQDEYMKYGNESFKVKTLRRKDFTETPIKDGKEPKKEKTEIEEMRLLNKVKGTLEALFAKVRKTKNQPKNGIVDAGFVEN